MPRGFSYLRLVTRMWSVLRCPHAYHVVGPPRSPEISHTD